MSIGENIKRLRLNCNLSQEELAKKLEIAQPTLCQIERGTKCASMELGKQIAEELGCTLDDLAE